MADVFDQIAQEGQQTPQGGQAQAGDIFDQLAQRQQAQQVQTQQPKPPTPEEQASQTRQMAVSGLTGMPTPNMSAQDKAEFEQGKAAGAVSVPVVAAGTVAAAYAPEIAMAVLKHVQEPGVIFKFPYGRAIEYYLTSKLGLSSGAVSKIASHLP